MSGLGVDLRSKMALAFAVYFTLIVWGFAAAAETVLHRGTMGEPDTLDPQKTFGATGLVIEFDLFEGLMTVDMGAKPILGIAQSIEMSDDGLTYRVTLKENLKWSDGTPLTADDFVFSFRRLLDPDTAAIYAPRFYPIANARGINRGELPVEALGIAALDAQTVEFQIESPLSYFQKLMGFLGALPLPRHVIEEHGDDWTRPENLVSNGPFKLVERSLGQFLLLEKNPYYHAADMVKIDRLYFYPTDNLSTAFQRYRAGEFHMVSSVPPNRLDWIQENMPEHLQISPHLGVTFVVFNTVRPPFDNVAVRKALSLAIDRDTVVGRLLKMGSTVARGFVPAQVSDYTAHVDPWLQRPLEERQREARRLLLNAGYGPDTPLSPSLYYFTQEDQQKLAVALQGMWREIGVNVEIANFESRAFSMKRKTGEFDMLISLSRAGFDDPMAFLAQFETQYIRGGGNISRYSNPEFDAAVVAADRSFDQAKRRALLEQTERMMLADYPVAPISYSASQRLKRPEIKGWVDNALGRHLSRYFWIDP